jgi:hypothetical protein
MIIEANTEPTATTNTKSKTFSLERVLLPEMRNIVNSTTYPTIESVTVRSTLYQLSKKKGVCPISLTCEPGGRNEPNSGAAEWYSIAGIAPPHVYI